MAKVHRLGSFLFCVAISVPARAATCSSLAALKLPKTVVTAGQDVGSGKFVPPEGRPSDLQLAAYRDLPAFCRVQGVLRPSGDSHIEFEVWLPASGRNGKSMGVGNGGSGEFIAYASAAVSNAPSLADTVRDGFACGFRSKWGADSI